jgi:hypothetical protein
MSQKLEDLGITNNIMSNNQIDLKSIEAENYDANVKKLTEWFTSKFDMLESLTGITPHTKLVDDGEVFSLYQDTVWSLMYRTFFTSDSGENHAVKIKSVFNEIDQKMKELFRNDYGIDLLYYENMMKLLNQCKQGLINLANHKDYYTDKRITSPLQNIVNFQIPLITIGIRQHIQFRSNQQQYNAMSLPVKIPTPPQPHQQQLYIPSHHSHPGLNNNTPSSSTDNHVLDPILNHSPSQ